MVLPIYEGFVKMPHNSAPEMLAGELVPNGSNEKATKRSVELLQEVSYKILEDIAIVDIMEIEAITVQIKNKPEV